MSQTTRRSHRPSLGQTLADARALAEAEFALAAVPEGAAVAADGREGAPQPRPLIVAVVRHGDVRMVHERDADQVPATRVQTADCSSASTPLAL